MTGWQVLGAVMLSPLLFIWGWRIWVWIDDNPKAFRDALETAAYMGLILVGAVYVFFALILVVGIWP
jgi:hypothetical protein